MSTRERERGTEMESSSASNASVDVDDCYTALLSQEDLHPISDEKYAFELQLQEAIYASILTHLPHQSLQTSLVPVSSKNEATQREFKTIIKTETGESSGSVCEVCAEAKSSLDMFENKNCSHVFCTDCIRKHIAVKIEENISLVRCPSFECKGALGPDICRSLVPTPVFEKWESALSESLVVASQKYYCPFRDCSALLLNDGEEIVTESECPNCRRLFCAQCRVPWHAGVSCHEYQELNEDEKGSNDLMVRELAKKEGWMRCPNCKFFVEKTEGCQHMTCRCGFQFCYVCGGAWSQNHACQST